jgi:hypothetical protein
MVTMSFIDVTHTRTRSNHNAFFGNKESVHSRAMRPCFVH